MGLYLCVFRDDDELLGVDLGSYDDFERLRNAARERDGRVFRRYGTLRVNISPTARWSPRDAARLASELTALREVLRREPPVAFAPGSWQAERARELGLAPASLADCFIDVEGRPVWDGLLALCRLSVETRQPILFQ